MKFILTITTLLSLLFTYSPIFSSGWDLVFINVGNGDSILITHNGKPQVLIDGGPDSYSDYYLSRYFPFSNCYIPYIILTHPHKDHLYGLTKILNHCKVDTLIHNELNFKSNLYESWLASISKNPNIGKIISYFPAGNKIVLNDLTIFVLWPSSSNSNSNESFKTAKPESNPNDKSIALFIDHLDFEALLLADLEAELQSKIDINPYLPYIQGHLDVIKVPHQGSKDALNMEFLAKFQIDNAVFSVGPNGYGHPSPAVVSYYESLNANILRTDVLDTVSIDISN